MDWSTIINYGVKILIVVILGIAELYLIPWLNEKRKDLQTKAKNEGWDGILAAIDKYVSAAEQIAITEGHDGTWKKEYVESMLLQYTSLTEIDAELDGLIESAVILLHNTLYGKVDTETTKGT